DRHIPDLIADLRLWWRDHVTINLAFATVLKNLDDLEAGDPQVAAIESFLGSEDDQPPPDLGPVAPPIIDTDFAPLQIDLSDVQGLARARLFGLSSGFRWLRLLVSPG